MSPPLSVGFSKSGAERKVSTPVPGTIEKSSQSPTPVLMEKVMPSPSGSVASTSVTAVVFSTTLMEATDVPLLLVIYGGKLTVALL